MYIQSGNKTAGYDRLKINLIVFRWLAVALGLLLTGFGAQKNLINPLPGFLMQFPIILVALLIIYHAIASFLLYQFDSLGLFVIITVISDALVGGFMSYYYGLSFLFAAVLLPTMVTTFYYDLLFAMVTALICSIFYMPVIAIPLLNNKKSPMGFPMLISLIFSAIIIYYHFIESLKLEEDAQKLVKKFNDERALVFEEHQNSRREIAEVFNELEKREEMIDALEEVLDKTNEEKAELMLTLENTQRNVDNLRKAVADVEKSSHVVTLEMTEAQEMQLNQLKAAYENQLVIMEEESEELKRHLAEMEERLRVSEKKVLSKMGEHSEEVEDLQQKIGILVGKINQLNIAIQSREALFESYSRLIENPDLKSTLSAIVSEAVTLVPSQTAVIFVLKATENGPMLFAEAALTPYKNLFVDYGVFPGDGPVGWVAKNKKPVCIKNGDLKLPDGQELATLLTYEKSALVIPMYRGDELTGALYLGKPEKSAYTEKELLLMNSFCKLAGPTIYTAKQFDKAAQVTLVDEVTGLYNKTYFFQRLMEEAGRSVRYKIPLTLITIEVVNYETFAESSEKAVQDRLIRDLSEILRNHVRETDLAARLDDNHFAILFIHSQKKDTILISERIRMSAEMRSFGTPQAKIAGLYMALGLANLPDDVEGHQELYDLAVKFMDESRSKGGSQTVFIP